MLNTRIYTYALTSKFAQIAGLRKAINIVYFHGFTMHDGNYNLVQALHQAGLLEAFPHTVEEEILHKNYEPLDPVCAEKILAKLQTLAPLREPAPTIDPQGEVSYGKLITVSLDFGINSTDLKTSIQNFVELLGERKTIFFAYSYGNLLAQLFIQRLSLLPEAKISVFHRLIGAYGINGSLLPYDQNYSILPEVAMKTAMNWTNSSFYAFLINMGMDKEKLNSARQRIKNTSEEVIKAQQQILIALVSAHDTFRTFLDNPLIMDKWRAFQAATDDKIFPIENLLKFGRAYKIPIRTVRGSHYITTTELIEMLCASTCYEEI
ncbi:hypothetical protein [Psittacicella gerlachiana]|uniref:Uncharacterized protein n=1 Tax=Psittacicella gerlachiana TaxID=2028574 RepID=A0A3A1YKF6_9GAMM|nr:hypothetical protein [Psittacicella gerlachiana]RIY37520.1 hypothetical protein CKF59_01590 [Psittacicella gerlachiana]